MLLDLVMPGVTGGDVLLRVREFSDVPIVVFTARADVSEIARRIGATDFIAKPIDPDLLLAKVRGVLAARDGSAASL